jgi:ankyrin repeat protein
MLHFSAVLTPLHAGAKRTALHTAAANGHLDIVTRLVLKHAASPIIRDISGATPIDDAIRHKHVSVVKFLATQPIATDLHSPAYIEMCASIPSLAAQYNPIKQSAQDLPALLHMCILDDVLRILHRWGLCCCLI